LCQQELQVFLYLALGAAEVEVVGVVVVGMALAAVGAEDLLIEIIMQSLPVTLLL
jgi:hypothetical protein